jgi:hypothetical protein
MAVWADFVLIKYALCRVKLRDASFYRHSSPS